MLISFNFSLNFDFVFLLQRIEKTVSVCSQLHLELPPTKSHPTKRHWENPNMIAGDYTLVLCLDLPLIAMLNTTKNYFAGNYTLVFGLAFN